MKKNSLNEQNPPQEQEQLERWCRHYGRSVLFLFSGYGLLGILLAAFTPNDILNYTWAQSLIGMTASIAPIFLEVPARSPIPDVVRFYFGVMWLLLPVFWFCLIYGLFKWPISCMSRPKVIEVMKSRTNALVFYAFVLLITFVSFYFSAAHLYQPEDGKITRVLFSSRFSLATGATFFNFGLLLFAVGMVMWPRAVYHSWSKLPWLYKQHKLSKW